MTENSSSPYEKKPEERPVQKYKSIGEALREEVIKYALRNGMPMPESLRIEVEKIKKESGLTDIPQFYSGKRYTPQGDQLNSDDLD